MKWFKNIKLSGRLIASFAAMIVLLAVMGVVGYWSFNTIQGNLKAIFRVNLPGIAHLIEAVRVSLTQLEEINQKLATEANAESRSTYRTVQLIMFLVSGLGLAVAALFVWLLNLGVIRPLQAISRGFPLSRPTVLNS